MWRFDAHVHSVASDGTDSLESLALKASEANLDGFALTDHDLLPDPNFLLALGANHNLTIVPGAEISTSHEGASAHLLAYFVRPNMQELADLLTRTRSSREDRLKQIVERIGADYPQITWERLVELHGPKTSSDDGPWGRPHVADLLIEEQIVPHRSAAFENVLNHDGPYYVAQWAADPREAVEVVKRAGAVPVLAHPLSLMRQRPLPGKILEEMTELGLFGIERDHREHDDEDRFKVDQIAAKLGLVTTGGSDYHGSGKPNELGENLTKRSVLEEIERAAL